MQQPDEERGDAIQRYVESSGKGGIQLPQQPEQPLNSLCPNCGVWHRGPDRLSACRSCWLKSTDEEYARYQQKRFDAWRVAYTNYRGRMVYA